MLSLSIRVFAEEPSPLDFIKEVTSPYVEKAAAHASSAIKSATEMKQEAVDYTSQVMELTQKDLEAYGKWMYKAELIPVGDAKIIEDKLNKLGEEKWELVSITQNKDNLLVVFKKPAVSYIVNYGRVPLGFLPVPVPKVR